MGKTEYFEIQNILRGDLPDSRVYINRELSQFEFQWRVLEEARDEGKARLMLADGSYLHLSLDGKVEVNVQELFLNRARLIIHN